MLAHRRGAADHMSCHATVLAIIQPIRNDWLEGIPGRGGISCSHEDYKFWIAPCGVLKPCKEVTPSR
jgi:hypothetical protein